MKIFTYAAVGPLVTLPTLPTLAYRARLPVRRHPCHRIRDKRTVACPSLGRSFWSWSLVHRCHQWPRCPWARYHLSARLLPEALLEQSDSRCQGHCCHQLGALVLRCVPGEKHATSLSKITASYTVEWHAGTCHAQPYTATMVPSASKTNWHSASKVRLHVHTCHRHTPRAENGRPLERCHQPMMPGHGHENRAMRPSAARYR